MRKIPITFWEKVEARFLNKGRGPCWIWEGSVHTYGWPQLNLMNVPLRIYEHERGPIPPGCIPVRLDHKEPECRELGYECRHALCVNPWHIEFKPTDKYSVSVEAIWDPTKTDHTAHYKRVQRQRKKEKHDNGGNPKGDDAPRGGEAGEGHGMA